MPPPLDTQYFPQIIIGHLSNTTVSDVFLTSKEPTTKRTSYLNDVVRNATSSSLPKSSSRRHLEETPNFDYLLVVDVDVASSSKFDVKNFLTNFVYDRSTWAAIGASQEGFYYDVWALRSSPNFDEDFGVRARRESWFGIAWPSAVRRAIGPNNRGIPLTTGLIDVQSAFGGAAIYAARFLNASCRYDGRRSTGWWFAREQCEHVSFNLCIRRNAGRGKFFINPKFQTFQE